MVLLLSASKPLNAVAFPQKAVLSLDTSSIRIGDQIQLKLKVTLPQNAKVFWPFIPDTLSPVVEVINKSKIDSAGTSRRDYVNYTQSICITSFDTGYHLIPPFLVSYSFKGDTVQHQIQSDGVFLRVNSVKVDTTLAIRDIKAPLKAPITLAELTPYIAAAAMLALIIGFVWYYFWRKKMNKPIFPILTKQAGLPWEDALSSLEALQQKRLWQSGKLKEFYTELTEIIRIYLSKQHGIEAMEMITSEILEAYSKAGLNNECKSKLAEVLNRADWVKFAKGIPEHSENDNCILLTREIIEHTIPVSNVVENITSENSEIENKQE